MAEPLPVVRLKNAWKSTHPWIFQRLVEKPAQKPKPGSIVDVVGVDGAFIGRGRLPAIPKAFGNLARRRVWAVVAVGALALGGRLALLPVLPIPTPYGHDQFSYLLAADTF